jgi:hypothetical protein
MSASAGNATARSTVRTGTFTLRRRLLNAARAVRRITATRCACAKKRQTLQRKLTIGASNDPLEVEATTSRIG